MMMIIARRCMRCECVNCAIEVEMQSAEFEARESICEVMRDVQDVGDMMKNTMMLILILMIVGRIASSMMHHNHHSHMIGSMMQSRATMMKPASAHSTVPSHNLVIIIVVESNDSIMIVECDASSYDSIDQFDQSIR